MIIQYWCLFWNTLKLILIKLLLTCNEPSMIKYLRVDTILSSDMIVDYWVRIEYAVVSLPQLSTDGSLYCTIREDVSLIVLKL